MNSAPQPTPFIPATHIDCTSCFTPVNKKPILSVVVALSLAPKIIASKGIEMASDRETSVAAAEAMDLSTPVKEETESTNIQTPTPTTTPRKRGRPAKNKTSAVRTPKTPKTPTKGTGTAKGTNAEAAGTGATEVDGDGEADNNSDTEASPSKKGKSTVPSGSGSATKKIMGPIPTSFEAAGVSDRLILRMRDEEGRGWPEINTAWMAMTGISVGKTTLRMRYRTMKSNFVSVDAEDETRLTTFKAQVEERFELEKWAKIADLIASDGGKRYPAISLQKKFKTMDKAGTATAAAAAPASSTTSAVAAGTADSGDARTDDLEEDEA